MNDASAIAHPPENTLLSLLSNDERERLGRHLQQVELAQGEVLYEPGATAEYAYFVDRGMISIVSVLDSGATIEVGTVGNKGVAGIAAAMSDGTTLPFRYFVQVAGAGRRIPLTILAAELRQDTALRRLLFRYQAAFMTQVMQGVACNGLHSVVQRCCKWLLMSQDSIGAPELAITHEFLAQMLGVRRASVSDVLRPLQDQGMIRANRGRVTILNRAGLEETSCQCYRIIRSEYERLLS